VGEALAPAEPPTTRSAEARDESAASELSADEEDDEEGEERSVMARVWSGRLGSALWEKARPARGLLRRLDGLARAVGDETFAPVVCVVACVVACVDDDIIVDITVSDETLRGLS